MALWQQRIRENAATKLLMVGIGLLICTAQAAAQIEIDAGYPGGNIVFERMEGNEVYLRQDLRDTPQWWFYWNFRARGAAGQTLNFNFTNGDVIGLQGPAISLDDGSTWSWLGTQTVSGTSFSYTFGEDADSVRFGYAMPYTEADLNRFLGTYEDNPHLSVETLTQDRSGRDVELLRLGKLDGEPQYRVALTARHHACETMASWALEGVLQTVLSDTEDGQWFRENVEVVAVPFMDKTGVEAGDQGKARAPHDHNEDYSGEPIYPTVEALKNFLPGWSDGKLRIAIDMHDPYIHDPNLHWVLVPEEPYLSNTRTFLDLLEQGRQGPLSYSPENEWLWPSTSPPIETKNFGWSATLPGMEVPTSLELPYSMNAGTPVTPDNARALGQDIARAIGHYYRGDYPVSPSIDFGAGVDFGAGTGDGQSGYSVFDRIGASSGWSSSPQAEAFVTTLGTEGTVTVSLNAVDGDLQWRDRGDVTNHPQGDMLEDLVAGVFGGGSGGDLKMTLSGLGAGTYEITTYHHDPLTTEGRIDIDVQDADGSHADVVTGLLQSAGYDNPTVAEATFQFVANGTDDIVITFDQTSSGYEVNTQYGTPAAVLSGFTLRQIPEPNTLVIALPALLGLVCRRRRR